MADILNVYQPVPYEESVSHYEIHFYLPYNSTRFENNDEVRITIQNQEHDVLPSESSLHISGKIYKTSNESQKPTNTSLNTQFSWVKMGNFFPYTEVKNIISEMILDATIVNTDGAARKMWLGKMCDNKIITNIRELAYSEPKDQKRKMTVYTNHWCLRKVVCALHSAKMVRSYALDNFEEMQWVDI